MRTRSLLASLVVLTSPTLAQNWDEAVDGDLSDDRFNPTPILLNVGGDTNVVATQQGNAFGRDIDYFTVTVPAGWRLEALFVDAYSAGMANQAFLGMQEGATMTVDPAAPNASLLLGGIVYGSQNVLQDILPAVGAFPQGIGFVPPLPAGEYTFWLNQTGSASTVDLRFETQVNDLGMTYCDGATPNSTGVESVIEGVGTSVVSANNFSYRVAQLPPNSFGFGIVSLTQSFAANPGGSLGNLCIGGNIGRYVDQIQSSGAAGEITTVVDLGSVPTSTGPINVVPTQTLNFQLWHRDSVGGAAVSNFSDGLAVTFQ